MLIKVGLDSVINNTTQNSGWFTLKSYKWNYDGCPIFEKADWSLRFSNRVFKQLNLNY